MLLKFSFATKVGDFVPLWKEAIVFLMSQWGLEGRVG